MYGLRWYRLSERGCRKGFQMRKGARDSTLISVVEMFHPAACIFDHRCLRPFRDVVFEQYSVR
jgi:hypothetical protein